MLMLTLLLVTVALFALFWWGSLLAQGYMYNQPADQLPLRAAAAALLVGLFLILWVWIDKRKPGKYETFFNVEGEESTQFTEFEAVRWQAVREENKISYRKNAKGETAEVVSRVKKEAGNTKFIDELTGKPFETSGSMGPDNAELTTVAVVVKGEDGNPVRYNAKLDKNERTGELTYPRDTDARRFVQEKGDRYIKPTQLGVIFIPRTVFLALFINVLHFAVWFVAFWLILRFNWSHALGFTVVFGLITMLAVMPMLFKPNRGPKPPPEAAAVVPRDASAPLAREVDVASGHARNPWATAVPHG
ncbi:MAG TPA: hypothetical protein VKE74_09980 [Gemmataceae bacterium]|nr:hypothetical protein [Gemmataceae bacterium]